MLQFKTNKYSRLDPPRTVTIDLHDLPVPGSDLKAHQFTGPDLYKHCKKLGVPGIERYMAHQEIALRLGTFMQEPEATK